MRVDLYHSGSSGQPISPFLLMPVGAKALPPHPERRKTWEFWKQTTLNAFKKQPEQAKADLGKFGFYIE